MVRVQPGELEKPRRRGAFVVLEGDERRDFLPSSNAGAAAIGSWSERVLADAAQGRRHSGDVRRGRPSPGARGVQGGASRGPELRAGPGVGAPSRLNRRYAALPFRLRRRTLARRTSALRPWPRRGRAVARRGLEGEGGVAGHRCGTRSTSSKTLLSTQLTSLVPMRPRRKHARVAQVRRARAFH